MKRSLTLLLLLLCSAMAFGETPSVDAIVKRMVAMTAARNAALHSYQSTRTYQVSYKGFPKSLEAQMVVKLDFTAPATKKFTVVSQSGSKVLLQHVLKKAVDSEVEATDPVRRAQTALTPENFEFQLLGEDNVNGRPAYVLRAKPKHATKFVYDGRIWVDTNDYAVMRIEASPAKNPSFWISRASIQQSFRKVDGVFWLPELNHSTSHVRLGGDAVLTIQYGEYQITSADAVKSADLSSQPTLSNR